MHALFPIHEIAKRTPNLWRYAEALPTLAEEQAIKKQLFKLAKQGYYVEPTSACVIAGLEHTLAQSEKIVSILTGTGLKATEKILTCNHEY